jgi:hypothetical protein
MLRAVSGSAEAVPGAHEGAPGAIRVTGTDEEERWRYRTCPTPIAKRR